MKAMYGRGVLPGMLSLALMAGCATTRHPEGNRATDVLTRREIMSVRGANNLYDVVQRLRPRWLMLRTQNTGFGLPSTIFVFENQTLLGDTETLRGLQPVEAYKLRWVSGTTAKNTLPGLAFVGHVAGAIILSPTVAGGGGDG